MPIWATYVALPADPPCATTFSRLSGIYRGVAWFVRLPPCARIPARALGNPGFRRQQFWPLTTSCNVHCSSAATVGALVAAGVANAAVFLVVPVSDFR